MRGAFYGLLVAASGLVVQADPVAVLRESFEDDSSQSWTLLREDAYPVSAGSSFFEGSNTDGLDGERFLLFGSGTRKGRIRFELRTVQGRTYALSYTCGATDSWTFDQTGEDVWFKSSVAAFHGMKTVINHQGNPVEVEDLETLGSHSHQFTVPGIANWRINAWEANGYSFTAKSATTRIEFSTTYTTGMASVGVLDQVEVTTDPFVFLATRDSALELLFAGTLEESTDLEHWPPLSPQPVSPWSIPPTEGPRFFRVAAE